MNFIRIEFEARNGYYIINTDRIQHIDVYENKNINKKASFELSYYAQVYFTEGRGIILNKEQYKQLFAKLALRTTFHSHTLYGNRGGE